MKFLADEHVDIHAIDALKQNGIDIVSVQELDKRGESDEELLRFANESKRTMITKDEDFLKLNAQGIEHYGILFLTKTLDIGMLIREVWKVATLFEPEHLKNRVIFIPFE